MKCIATLELDSEGILFVPREHEFSEAELANLNLLLDPLGRTELANTVEVEDWDAVWAGAAERLADELTSCGGMLVVGGPGVVRAFRGAPAAGRVVLAHTAVPWAAKAVWFGDASIAFGFGQEFVCLPFEEGASSLHVALVQPEVEEVFPSLFLWGEEAEVEDGARIVRSDWRWKPVVGGLALVWRSRRGRRQTLAFLTGAQTTGGQVVLRGSAQPGANPFKARIVGVDDGIWTVESVE
jgi:hypothetical protein